MAKCAALVCTFLDLQEYYIECRNSQVWSDQCENNFGVDGANPPQPPALLADPDIAGLGVILAFLISAYVTWIVVAIGYACGYTDEGLLGNLDRRLIRIKPRQSDRWGPLLVKVVLILSDQQILTGVSILTAGYANRCSINVYHWQVVVYLAWMSSGTHLITLSVLRDYLREKSILRLSRVAGMFILFLMLFIAITPTGSQTYYNIISGNKDDILNPSCAGVPSACFWNQKYWNGWRWNAGLSYALLISSYIARAAALFESSEAFFRRNIRDRLLGKLEEALDRKVKNIRDRVAHRRRASWAQKLCYHTYLATYAVTLASLELYSSFLAPLLWVLLNLIWGSLQLLLPRMKLMKLADQDLIPDLIAEENTFGFGQIIPLMLLALPLVAAFEAYYEVLEPSDKHQTPSSSPKRANSQDSGPLQTIELSHIIQPSAEQVVHEQLDDTATEFLDRSLVRADTEQLLCDNRTSTEQPGPESLRILTSHSPTNWRPDISLISEVSPTWTAHHQDFYASKWFRSIQIFIIVSVIGVFLVIYLFASPLIDYDFFALNVIMASLPTFLCPVFLLLCIVVGGIFRSKVFR